MSLGIPNRFGISQESTQVADLGSARSERTAKKKSAPAASWIGRCQLHLLIRSRTFALAGRILGCLAVTVWMVWVASSPNRFWIQKVRLRGDVSCSSLQRLLWAGRLCARTSSQTTWRPGCSPEATSHHQLL